MTLTFQLSSKIRTLTIPFSISKISSLKKVFLSYDVILTEKICSEENVENYLAERRNPNDVDFEKEELIIASLSMEEPRDESFIAHRAKNFALLSIQGNFLDL